MVRKNLDSYRVIENKNKYVKFIFIDKFSFPHVTLNIPYKTLLLIILHNESMNKSLLTTPVTTFFFLNREVP